MYSSFDIEPPMSRDIPCVHGSSICSFHDGFEPNATDVRSSESRKDTVTNGFKLLNNSLLLPKYIIIS